MKGHRILIVLIVLCIVLSAGAAMALGTIFGRSVTMNLAFAIGSNKSTDVLQSSADYSSSHNALNGTVAGIAASGSQTFNGTTNGSYSPAANLITVTQSATNNKFLLVLSNGTGSEISGKIALLGNGKILANIFGVMTRISPAKYPLYIIAEYDDIDIGNSTTFSGSTGLVMRNYGPTSNGQANITIDRTA